MSTFNFIPFFKNIETKYLFFYKETTSSRAPFLVHKFVRGEREFMDLVLFFLCRYNYCNFLLQFRILFFVKIEVRMDEH